VSKLSTESEPSTHHDRVAGSWLAGRLASRSHTSFVQAKHTALYFNFQTKKRSMMLLANAGHAAPNLEKPPQSDPRALPAESACRCQPTKAAN